MTAAARAPVWLRSWTAGTSWPERFGGVPLWLWLLVALGPAVWLLYLSPLPPHGPEALDWYLYRSHAELWRTTGSPYELPPGPFSPFDALPYTYPPTSWPLLPLAAVVPPMAAWLAVIPILLTPPRLRLLPTAAFLLTIGLAFALWPTNVSLIAAGALSLAFRRGPIGGVAFAVSVALRPYPLLLLPFFLSDRRWLAAFAITLTALAVSGTLILGIQGWVDFALINLRMENLGRTWNPFGELGLARVVPALAVAAVGLRLRSVTLTMLGATWIAGHVTDHYLLVLAAVLPFERRWALPLTFRRESRAIRPVGQSAATDR